MMMVCILRLPQNLLLNLSPELEPRKPRNENVEVFVDLLATMEDHVEVC